MYRDHHAWVTGGGGGGGGGLRGRARRRSITFNCYAQTNDYYIYHLFPSVPLKTCHVSFS